VWGGVEVAKDSEALGNEKGVWTVFIEADVLHHS